MSNLQKLKDKADNEFRKLDWSKPTDSVWEVLGMTKWFDEKVAFLSHSIELAYEEGRKEKVSYQENYSHYHCWDNPNNPCGINKENHKRCCLCDKTYPLIEANNND